MELQTKTRTGQPRCTGIKLNGDQCREPREFLGNGKFSQWCIYCGKLVCGETTPQHPGFDPRKGKIQGYDWATDFKKYQLK